MLPTPTGWLFGLPAPDMPGRKPGAAGVQAKACFALVFGIDCSVIDRQSRLRLARIAVIFQGEEAGMNIRQGPSYPVRDMFHMRSRRGELDAGGDQ